MLKRSRPIMRCFSRCDQASGLAIDLLSLLSNNLYVIGLIVLMWCVEISHFFLLKTDRAEG